MAVLVASNLRKSFQSGGKTVAAVKGVSLTIDSGEILAFLGQNGAGKTTTIKMIAGLVEPDEGSISVCGRSPLHDRRAYTDISTVLEGTRNLYLQLTALENLEYFGVLKGLSNRAAHERAVELLELVELTHKANARARDLSRGMQQKLSIAVSLVNKPKLLLLDEPTNGLDVEAGEMIKDVLRKLSAQGQATLLTTHQLDVAQELAHRVCIIRAGEIIEESSTASLIQRFSGDAFAITFEGELDEARQAKLVELGFTLDGNRVFVQGESNALYEALAVVRPNAIVDVSKNEADLTHIYLKLVREGGAA